MSNSRAHFGITLFFLLFGVPVSAKDKNPLELANLPVEPGAQRLAYGNDPLQFGELRIPIASGPHPVAIVVHGGCWSTQLGKWDPRTVAIDNMRPMAAALTKAGFATWNVEYRRVGDQGGGWPGTFQDVANAADFLRTLPKEHNLDLSQVMVIGHSSGGHLALWLAARQKLPRTSELFAKDPIQISNVFVLDGPPDLEAMVPIQEDICPTPAVTNLMGGKPSEHPQRYAHASASRLLPINVGQEFFSVAEFAPHVEAYQALAKSKGDEPHVTIFPDAEHFSFIDPDSSTWEKVLDRIMLISGKNESSH